MIHLEDNAASSRNNARQTPSGPARVLFPSSTGSARGDVVVPLADDSPSLPIDPHDKGSEATGEKQKFSLNVKSYVQWEPLPPGHPIEIEHATKGLGGSAYVHWKRLNLSLKDQFGKQLGPLHNAISYDLRASVGNALLNYKELHPKPNMTGTEITEFIKSDGGYEWVKRIPDDTLLKYLDKFFSVGADPDPFLSMRFRPNVPHILADGSVNYMVTAHSAFAEQWLDALRELRKSGWDDSTTDLRQAYITALEPCSTLHKTAVSFNTDSHDLLIAHMRAWTQNKTSNQIAERKHKEHIQQTLAAQGQGHSTAAAPAAAAPAAPAVTGARKAETVKALRTELAKVQNQLKQHGAAVTPTKSQSPTYFCNGCGYTYQRDGRRIPCEGTCVFEDHAEHNTAYRSGTPWPDGKKKLFWGTPEEYQKKYGKEMPAKGIAYLDLRAAYVQRNQNSRGRS